MVLLRISSYVAVLVWILAANAEAEPVLWFNSPATYWNQEALPLGNGRVGVMVFGGLGTEQIQFTEETLWTGEPHDYAHPGASNYLQQLQAYIFATNQTAFWTLASTSFMSVPLRQCAFQPGGNLELSFNHNNASNYIRRLDLDTASATVEYVYNGVRYMRELFASRPDDVVVVRLTASAPGALSFTARFTTVHTAKTNSVLGNDLIMDAAIAKAANGLNSRIWFRARARVIPDDGVVKTDSGSITVSNATGVTILLAVGSNFVSFEDVSGDPTQRVLAALNVAATRSFAELKARHLEDYQPLFRRVRIDLGTTSKTNLPTGARIRRIIENNDPDLLATYFQFGRYLMIAGSRPGCHPLTLQGKWNNVTNPSWEGKMTLNINQEMNYWLAEVGNLPECHQPMFDLVRDLMVSGARVARTHYNAQGWVVHHNTDLWRGAAPINGRDGLWPAGSAWLCQHLWEHFAYNRDTNFLATNAYPAMKAAAQFYLDFLVQHPVYTNWWVTCPSYSPEHDHPVFGANIPGPTMDNELIRELFKNVIAASEILSVDAEFRNAVSNMMVRLPPLQIGRYGQLQEWLEDVDVPGDTHRHCSHLVGLFPGDSISVFHTPELAMAARVSVDWRGDVFGDKGWAKAWRACLRARLCDGDHAYLHLTNIIAQNLSSNMMFTDVGNRQVDGTFGAAMAIAEMLLQSHRNEIHLLPALPTAWTNGQVTGLRARGGFEVSIQWSNHAMVEAKILSRLGGTCRVRSRWPIEVWSGGMPVRSIMAAPGLWQFDTVTNTEYIVTRACVSEFERAAVLAVANGSTAPVTNAALSSMRGLQLIPHGPGARFLLAITNPPTGMSTLVLGVNKTRTGGKYRIALGFSQSNLVELTTELDAYSPTSAVFVLPTRLFTPTNRFDFWTNMLTETELVPVDVPPGAVLYLAFTCIGTNPAATGTKLCLDYVRFAPWVARPTLSAAVSDGEVVLRWPAAAAFWSLQFSTNLTAGEWQPYPGPVYTESGACVVTASPTGLTRMFFRLANY